MSHDWETVKMLCHETVHRNRIKMVAMEKAFNSQKCLVTLYVVGWVIIVHVFSLFSLCLLVILAVSNFDFESGTLVLIAPVPGHCVHFNVLIDNYNNLFNLRIFKEKNADLMQILFSLYFDYM